MNGEKGATRKLYTRIFVMGSCGVPRRVQVPQKYVQRTTTATAAAATIISAGEHDGNNDDAKPNEPTAAVHDFADDDSRASTDGIMQPQQMMVQSQQMMVPMVQMQSMAQQ